MYNKAIAWRLGIWSLAQSLAVLLFFFGQHHMAYVVGAIIAGYASYMAADSTNTGIDRLLGIIAWIWFIIAGLAILYVLYNKFMPYE